jgi:hypothetical protein
MRSFVIMVTAQQLLETQVHHTLTGRHLAGIKYNSESNCNFKLSHTRFISPLLHPTVVVAAGIMDILSV